MVGRAGERVMGEGKWMTSMLINGSALTWGSEVNSMVPYFLPIYFLTAFSFMRSVFLPLKSINFVLLFLFFCTNILTKIMCNGHWDKGFIAP